MVRPVVGQTGLLLARADGDEQARVVGQQSVGRVGLFLRADDFDVCYERMINAGVRFTWAMFWVEVMTQKSLGTTDDVEDRLEIEDLQAFNCQRVVDVVEEAGVPAFADPLVQTARQRAREMIGQRKELTLRPVEHVKVLDRFVDLPIFQVADAIAA